MPDDEVFLHYHPAFLFDKIWVLVNHQLYLCELNQFSTYRISMDILYFLGGIAAICLGAYLLYVFFKTGLEGTYFARRNKITLLLIGGLILAFGGLFTAIHHFCLIFNITR